MKTKSIVILSLIAVTLAGLSACGGAAAPEVFVEQGAREEPAMPAIGDDLAGEPAFEGEAQKSALPMPTMVYQTVPDTENAVPGQAAYVDRMILKNAEVSLVVEDSDVAIDRLTQIVGDENGYIVSSRIWYQPYADGENYKYASMTLGIPVDRFEVTMRRIRGLAVQVVDENASGQDVTDQFVDLQSRLTNLEATQARIQSFLEDAKTVDEALRINQELAAIEAQIEEVKGRMSYLSDRAAFSSITVTLSPELPEIEPTPAKPWSPGGALDDALELLVKAYQGIVEFAIWMFVAVLPILALPALLIWLVVRLVRRKPAKPASAD